MKLHIGAADNILAGWLNTDVRKCHPNEVFLDVKRPFPMPGGSCTRIFSEHLHEHLEYDEGMRCLQECYRVLEEGGRIRITTPDLMSIVKLLNADLTRLQSAYLDMQVRDDPQHMRQGHKNAGVFMVNHLIRLDDCHRFIYDEGTLRECMTLVGFKDIVSCSIMDSDDPEFVGLEHVNRLPPGMLQLESMTLEGDK